MTGSTDQNEAFLIRVDAREQVFERSEDGTFVKKDGDSAVPFETRAASVQLVAVERQPVLVALNLAPDRDVWIEVTVERDPAAGELEPDAKNPARVSAEAKANWSDSFADIQDLPPPRGVVNKLVGESSTAQVFENRFDVTTDAGQKLTMITSARVEYITSDDAKALRDKYIGP